MSVPFGRAVLTLDDMTQPIRRTFEQFTDPRRGKNTRYTRVEAGLSVFSVFFMQSRLLLEDQRRLDQWLGKHTAQTLLGVHQIPADHQSRHLLDATDPGQVRPLFSSLFQALLQAGVGEGYRWVNRTLLRACAGVQYFSSSAIHGPQCAVRQHATGSVTYSHRALTAVLVKPGLAKVIPLAPALVRPQDGAAQPDCELNAAQRWVADGGGD